MEGWPRIPNQNSASSSRPKSTIPAPGTVVMASVEEELGDGVYSLRWGGNRISVTSRSPLKTGQSLILKAATNAEGKPTLVVQGPALPEPGSITGRVIYGPGKNRNHANQNSAADQTAPPPETRPQGNGIAAGTAKATIIQPATPTEPVANLIGAVLEPLPEFEAAVKFLAEAVEEEKERLEQTGEKDQKKSDAQKSGEKTQDADSASDENAAVHDRRSRPAPGRYGTQPTPRTPDAESTPVDAPAGSRIPPSRSPHPDQFGKPVVVRQAQPPQTTAPPPATVSSFSSEREKSQIPAAAVAPAQPAAKPAVVPPDGNAPAQPEPPPAPPPQNAAPAGTILSNDSGTHQAAALPPEPDMVTVLPESSGPKVPDPLPASSPQGDGSTTTTPQHNSASDIGAAPREGLVPAVPESPPVVRPQGDFSATTAPSTNSAATEESVIASPSSTIAVLPESAGPDVPEQLPSAGTQGKTPGVVDQKTITIPPGEVTPSTPNAAPATLEGREAAVPEQLLPAPAPDEVIAPKSSPVAGSHPSIPSENGQPTASENTPPLRQSGQYGPPRSDTGTIRARQATLPTADQGMIERGVDARAAGRPEAVLKEALTQMIKAAELPLAASADAPPLTLGGKPPPETLNKAAELLLQAAGITPDEEAVSVARALIKQNISINRDTVQTVLTAAAEAPEAEREAVMNAAARLLSKDIPISPPLVAGLVDVIDRRAGTHVLMQQTQEALAVESGIPEAQQLMEAAGELLDMLHVDLASPDAPEALERYLSTFGREAFGKALALVETAAQAVLESSPELQRLDQAIAAVVTELTDELAQVQADELADEHAAQPPESAPALAKEPTAPVQVTPLPARPLPSAPINAYLNAPRAFNIAEALKNLPPMPQIISINTPIPQEAQPPAGPQSIPTPLPIPVETVTEGTAPPGEMAKPSPATPTAPMPREGEGFVMPKLDSLFQIPGLNRPEMELLKPSGFMERFLHSAADGSDAQESKEEARTLLRQLTSEDARQVERGLRDLKNKSSHVLKETAIRLQEREVEVIRANAVLSRLADAATSLRDLGRQLLAVKAENLAGQDREPGVMLAEVPFKLNDDAGEGRMQMFYRRRKDKGDGWNNRVILDLNTTHMGPVLGDMRFFGQDMVLNMFVDHGETAQYLQDSAHDLVAALADKGFRVKARFMVLPPRSAPEIRAERPVIVGEEGVFADPDGDRKLDIKG